VNTQQGMWAIRRYSDGWYFMGHDDLFAPTLEHARLYTEEEKEVLFSQEGEVWSKVLIGSA
jgi:hypothetical protein